ncbi:diguanylate cyclase [Spongisporangium articulatum]|uniref:Diguanylate cyclase n=1 Tax=Spongisporangium articulatum TaxID=3362603 RepID=A0ABW8AL02_9ACTN
MRSQASAAVPDHEAPRVLVIIDVAGNVVGAVLLVVMALVPGIIDPRADFLLWAGAGTFVCFGLLSLFMGRVHPWRIVPQHLFGVVLVSVLGVITLNRLLLVAVALANVLIALSLSMTHGRTASYAMTAFASAGTAVAVLAGDGSLEWRLIIAAAAAIMSWAPAMAVLEFREQLNAALREARQLAVHDPLTGLLNRRGLTEKSPGVVTRATEQGTWLVLLMADLDHFKLINDQHGHAEGDEMLRRVASVVRAVVREEDVVARTGGEELVVVATVRRRAEVEALAERIRAAVEQELSPWGVTVSIGVLGRRPTHPGTTGTPPAELVWTMIDAADGLMYAAKQSGRNAVRAGTLD